MIPVHELYSLTLAELADLKYSLTREVAIIEERTKVIDAILKELMESGEVAMGSQGIGYRMTEESRFVYPAEVTQTLEAKGLLPHFAKVTTTQFYKLVRERELTRVEFERFQGMAKTKPVYVLRQVTTEEAKGV